MAVIDSAILLLRGHTYSGSGDWLDESGNNYDATPTGVTFDTDHFIFDADDEELRISHDVGLDIGAAENCTLMVVFETADVSPPGWLAGKKLHLAAGAPGYATFINSATIRGQVADGTNVVEDSAGPISNNTKHVAAMVRNVSDVDAEAFVDGTGSGTAETDTTGSLATTQDFTIGRRPDSNNVRFVGWIYAVAFWDTALSDADIVTAGEELTDNWLTATFEGSGTIAADLEATAVLTAAISGTATVVSDVTTGVLTLTPDGDQTGDSNVINEHGSTTNTYLSIDDDPDTPVLTDYVFTNGVDGYQFYDLSATPSDFGAMTALRARADVRKFNVLGSTVNFYVQVFAADEVTNWTDEIVVATQATVDGLAEVEFTLNGTGLAADKAGWDTARVKIRWDFV